MIVAYLNIFRYLRIQLYVIAKHVQKTGSMVFRVKIVSDDIIRKHQR